MKKILFLDIETDDLNIEKAKVKFIGCIDAIDNFKIFNFIEENKKDIQKYLNQYDKIITFNGNNFDLPILKNNKINVPYWKHIDLYEVFKKRAGLIKNGGFKSYSLENISNEVKIDIGGKGEIDFNIFKKNEWTKEELEKIEIYLKQDVILTKKLWEYLIEKFDNLKEFLSREDVEGYKHITSSTGAYAYKVIANQLGIKEKYEDINGNIPYEGSFCMEPTKEKVMGNILYLDFASLYPMLYIHANLFSHNCKCCSIDEKWSGNNFLKINGKYCSKQQGKIEKIIKNFYIKRKEFKKNKDDREFAIKIVLNSLYGISSKPSFKYLYHPNIASDCTSLARQCINYVIKIFKENKFGVIYADTDSTFIEIPENKTKKEAIELAKEISFFLSNQFPFPWEEFNLKLEDEIKYLQFFKGNSGKNNKKHYLYINNDDKLIIKGIDIIKKNCTALSLYIFNKYLKKQIIENKNCFFEKKYIDNLINDIIKENKLIIAKSFNIKDIDGYKSMTSIYNLIREKYGNGEIKLIKNYKIGAGKGIKYCSLEEAKELNIEDLNLEDVYKELSVFIKDYKNIKLEKINKEKSIIKKIQQKLF